MPVINVDNSVLKPDNKKNKKPVVIGDNEINSGKKKVVGYWCPSCHCKMVRIGEGEYECTHCLRILDITEDSEDNNLAKTAAIPEPETMDNNEVFVTTSPEPENPFRKRPTELKGTFKVMSQKGIRVTNYWTNEKQEED